jgi:hypothetical protein
MGPGKWDARESNVHARVREGLVGVFLSLSLSLSRARARARSPRLPRRQACRILSVHCHAALRPAPDRASKTIDAGSE